MLRGPASSYKSIVLQALKMKSAPSLTQSVDWLRRGNYDLESETYRPPIANPHVPEQGAAPRPCYSACLGTAFWQRHPMAAFVL